MWHWSEMVPGLALVFLLSLPRGGFGPFRPKSTGSCAQGNVSPFSRQAVPAKRNTAAHFSFLCVHKGQRYTAAWLILQRQLLGYHTRVSLHARSWSPSF